MSEILVYRKGNALVPFDELAEQDLSALPEGKPVMAKVTQKRSVPHNRLYRACIASICRSGGFDDGPKILHDVTKMSCGCFKVISMSGMVYRVPDSVAFDRMGQDEFNEFFRRAVAFWQSERLYPWIKPALRAKLEGGAQHGVVFGDQGRDAA